MENLELYRKALLLTSLGNKISSKPVKVSDIYANLKALHQEATKHGKTTELPSAN